MDIVDLVDFLFFLSPITSIACFWATFCRFHCWRMMRTTRRMNLNPWSCRRKVSFRLGFHFYYYYTIIDFCDNFFFFFRET